MSNKSTRDLVDRALGGRLDEILTDLMRDGRGARYVADYMDRHHNIWYSYQTWNRWMEPLRHPLEVTE